MEKQHLVSHLARVDEKDPLVHTGLAFTTSSVLTKYKLYYDTYKNRLGGCHGGLLSTIVDVGGSLAIAAEDMEGTGVSTGMERCQN